MKHGLTPKLVMLWVLMLGTASAQNQRWAYEQTFDHIDPISPSSTQMPSELDFSVTHRTHPADHLGDIGTYLADHGPQCEPPPAMHSVITTNRGGSEQPDPSFFICKQHMMSSMGDVSGYSVTSFWPRQAFAISSGAVLEFDVNINENPGRFWWEILITPRDQMKVAAAEDWLPIDETYSRDRIVLAWSERGRRSIRMGAGRVPPQGWTVEASDWRDWRVIDADDPALTDRRIRRTMRILFTSDSIQWMVQKADGSFDSFTAHHQATYPFDAGLVLFKTHAYTPTKSDNHEFTTWHWDNIRFNGPVLDQYEVAEAEGIGYLQANGNRPIGDSVDMAIELPVAFTEPVLFGQVHSPLRGQVLVSINDGDFQRVDPIDYADGNCYATGWSSFRLPLTRSQLRVGSNQIRFQVGPRPGCVPNWMWNGFSIKDLEIQYKPYRFPLEKFKDRYSPIWWWAMDID